MKNQTISFKTRLKLMFVMSIKLKLALIITALMISLVIVLTWVQVDTEESSLNEQVAKRAILMRQNFDKNGTYFISNLTCEVMNYIQSYSYDIIQKIAEKHINENKEITNILLIDHSLMMQVNTANPKLNKNKADQALLKDLTSQSLSIKETYTNGEKIIDFINPVWINDQHFGFIIVAYSLNSIEKENLLAKKEISNKRSQMIIKSLKTSSPVILICLLVIFLLSATLTHPLIQLTQFAIKLSTGNFSEISFLKISSWDEIGALADSFMKMSRILKKTYEELEESNKNLEQKVIERTYELDEKNKQLTDALNEVRIAMDAAKSANKVKSDFLAFMSHEIRTPMNAIIGMAELLQETTLNNEQERYIQIFKSNGEILLNIINDILDISKVEAGKIELENIVFDLTELIQTTGDLMYLKAQEKGLELIIDTNFTDHLHLIGDPVRLRQVLINLLSNAIKFTVHGKVSLGCETSYMTSNDVDLKFCITDTGIGIPEDKKEIIFESFTQADSSITREYGGTGLGLAISKRIVELMGGKIWVESYIGQGSKFYFTTRFKLPDINETCQFKNEMRKEISPLKLSSPMQILLADDYPHNRIIIQQYLKNEPCNVDIAANGAIVLEKFLVNQYDLILMDMQMPVMDGYNATLAIRQNESDNNKNRVPIIAITAYASEDDIKKCMDAGCDDYICKPVRKNILLKILGKYEKKQISPQKTGERPNQNIIPDEKSCQSSSNVIIVEPAFIEFIPIFLNDIRSDIEHMKIALSEGDYKAIAKMSHNIKGAGGGYGLHVVTDIAKSLEAAAEKQNDLTVKNLINKLNDYVNNIQIVKRDEG